MIVLDVLPILFWAILWCYWFISAFRAKKSVGPGRSWWVRTIGIRLVILAFVIFFISTGHGGAFGPLLASFFNRSAASSAANLVLSIVGVILCAAGVAFAVWARVYLGKNWGVPMSLREKPELVTSGPYQFVRHPIYSGFFLAMFGTALVDGPIWFLILILMGIYFIYSARTEQKMMINQFPNEYPKYMKRTKMLIPFIL